MPDLDHIHVDHDDGAEVGDRVVVVELGAGADGGVGALEPVPGVAQPEYTTEHSIRGVFQIETSSSSSSIVQGKNKTSSTSQKKKV